MSLPMSAFYTFIMKWASYDSTIGKLENSNAVLDFVVLLHTATANGFQMVTSGAQSKAVSDWAITSLEVRHFNIISTLI